MSFPRHQSGQTDSGITLPAPNASRSANSDNRSFVKKHPRATGLVMTLMTTLLTLFCLEIVFRSWAYFELNEGRLEDLQEENPTISDKRMQLTREHQIKLSANPKIIYEHKPNLHLIDSVGNEYTINGSGFRGPEHP